MAVEVPSNLPPFKTLVRGNKSEMVRVAQRALQAAGHELVADGDFGNITYNAVKKFQAANGLEVDGKIGPLTARMLGVALASVPPLPPDMGSVLQHAPWLSTMRAISGTKEVPGSKNNPFIISWADDIAKAFPDMSKYAHEYTSDAIPWCGHGAAWCFAQHGLRPPFGDEAVGRYLWATSWGKSTDEMKVLKKPVLGAVLSFRRTGGGHVGFYESEDNTHYHCRGCNQSDMVNVIRISKSNLFAATWPRHFAMSTSMTPIIRTASNYRESDSLA